MKREYIVDSLKRIVHSQHYYRPKTLDFGLTLFLLLFFISSQTHAQDILKGEYFFDTDPGVGNGAALTFAPGSTVNFTSSISIASLSAGFHQLAIRVKETGGLWSEFESRGFYISDATADSPNIVGAEYFFDADPGNGNGIPIAVTAGVSVNFTVSLPTSLSSGFHFLAIRTKGANGKWGVFESRGFYVTGSTSNSPNITAAEYFFDSDPGNGNATPIAVTAGASVNFTVSLPVSLSPGFHFLAIRTKGVNGKWGVFEARGFYVTGSTTDVPTITKAEYFFDTDPGVGSGVNIPITAGATPNFTVSLPTIALAPGFHFLAIRAKRADGKWGIFESRGFYVSPIVANAADIVAAEYFIDGVDPGEGNGLPLTVTTPGPTVNQTFVIMLSGVPTGARKLNLRVKDANGIWSAIETSDFNVLVCTPPPAPTAAGASLCNSGTVTLTATAGATGAQVYRWYADGSTTTVLFTGASFTTPTINATTSFFVSVFDPATLCESNRRTVTASVITTSPPILNVTGSVTICQGNSIMISAPAGFANYTWSTGATTQQITVSASGNYTVTVGNGTCTSLPSAAANVNVAARPAKPSVAVTGSPLCEGQTINLQGPTGFASYAWSNGGTASQISTAVAGSYTLTVTDNNGCSSVPSDAVTIKSLPTKPAVFILGNTTFCEGQNATLVAPSGFATYAWSTGATTQQLTATLAGNYTLRITDATGCVSPLSDPIAIIVNPAPTKPIITASGSTTLCTGQIVLLNAPTGFSYLWSNGAVSRQLSVGQTGSFAVTVQDSKGCSSAASDQITVTVGNCNPSTNTRPPVIRDKPTTVPVDGKVTVSLIDLLSDPDNDLNLASLKIITPPSSGASATLDANGNLILDYKGILFSGYEKLTVEICDLANNCTRQELTIIVAGDVVVYNALSPNGDGLNEVLFLEYISLLEEAKNNKVRIFNRWGDTVYEAENYNNTTIAFKGISTSGDALPNGTYFYRIDFSSGAAVKTGFFSLRR